MVKVNNLSTLSETLPLKRILMFSFDGFLWGGGGQYVMFDSVFEKKTKWINATEQ
jgi:hypothetical protein